MIDFVGTLIQVVLKGLNDGRQILNLCPIFLHLQWVDIIAFNNVESTPEGLIPFR